MKTINDKHLKIDRALLASLEKGETCAITQENTLLAFLVPAYPPEAKRPAGLAEGEFTVPPDFNDSLPDDIG